MAVQTTHPPCPICGNRDRVPYSDRPEAACAGCGALERQRALLRDLTIELLPIAGARCLEVAPYNARVLGEPLRERGWTYESVDKRAVRSGRDPHAFEGFIDYDLDLADLRGVPTEHYELVLLQHVLAEVADDRAALDEIARVLALGGRALLEIPWKPDLPETRLVDRAQNPYGNRREHGADVLGLLEERFAAVEPRALAEGLYRGTVFVCRAAGDPTKRAAIERSEGLRPVSIHAIATPLTVNDPAWVGSLPVPAVTRGAAGTDRVELQPFPIVGDDRFAAEHPQRKPAFTRYGVRRISLMSVPNCALVGWHLVPVTEGRYVEEAIRGAKSFANRAFGRTEDGWSMIADAATETHMDEPVLAVGGKALSNYFHWMTEAVPRLLAARQRGSLAGLPVVMRPAETVFARRTLEWLGVEPQFVQEDVVHVPRAVIPTYPIDPRRGGRYGPELLALSRSFRDHHVPPPTSAQPTRVLLSRRDAPTRHVANEGEVEARLGEHGLTTVVVGELELEDQIALFSNAELIVAQHGASLTGLLFAPPGCRVVELNPRTFPQPTPYWTFASLAGLRYQLLACDVAASAGGVRLNQADIRVDVDQLERLITDG